MVSGCATRSATGMPGMANDSLSERTTTRLRWSRVSGTMLSPPSVSSMERSSTTTQAHVSR